RGAGGELDRRHLAPRSGDDHLVAVVSRTQPARARPELARQALAPGWIEKLLARHVRHRRGFDTLLGEMELVAAAAGGHEERGKKNRKSRLHCIALHGSGASVPSREFVAWKSCGCSGSRQGTSTGH